MTSRQSLFYFRWPPQQEPIYLPVSNLKFTGLYYYVMYRVWQSSQVFETCIIVGSGLGWLVTVILFTFLKLSGTLRGMGVWVDYCLSSTYTSNTQAVILTSDEIHWLDSHQNPHFNFKYKYLYSFFLLLF